MEFPRHPSGGEVLASLPAVIMSTLNSSTNTNFRAAFCLLPCLERKKKLRRSASLCMILQVAIRRTYVYITKSKVNVALFSQL